MNLKTVTHVSQNIRQVGRRRKKFAIAYFAAVWSLTSFPIFIYSNLGVNNLSIAIYYLCLVGAFYFAEQSKKFWQAARRADRGADIEEQVILLLQELEEDGWEIIYNIPLRVWGDANVFLRSPSNNYFVIDLKNNNGIVFFDGIMLKLRYGTEVFPFSNNRDILKVVKGQASELRELQGVRCVTPIVCFTKAVLEIDADNYLVQDVHVISIDSLLDLLRKVG
jgi:hypothetical protein